MHTKWLQLGPTLCDTVDCSLPGSSVHGILQARILEWAAMTSSRDLLDLGIELASPAAAALQADSLPLSHRGSPYLTAKVLFCLAWLFSYFPFFLYFLTSLVKLILWLKFFYGQKAGRGHGWEVILWRPHRVLLSHSSRDSKSRNLLPSWGSCGRGSCGPGKSPSKSLIAVLGKKLQEPLRLSAGQNCHLSPWPQQQLCLCLCWDPKSVCPSVSMSVSLSLPLSPAGLSIYSFQALAESVSTRDLVSVHLLPSGSSGCIFLTVMGLFYLFAFFKERSSFLQGFLPPKLHRGSW